MAVPEAVLAAALRFAGQVSMEFLADAIAAFSQQAHADFERRLSGDAADRFGALVHAWQMHAPGLSSSDIANVLAGMAYTLAEERRTKRVELVWTGPDAAGSTFRSTGPALLELIRCAAHSIYLVTFAAYKVPQVAEALRAALARGVRVVLILESEGKVSFDPLPHLSPEGGNSSVEVYHWPQDRRKRDGQGRFGTLHAKFAVADRQRLLVSSANLTESALDLNIELGVLLHGGAAASEAVDHIDELIRVGVLQRQMH